MDTKRSFMRISLVLLVALGAGHMVQNMQKNLRGQGVRAASGLGGIEQVVAGPTPVRHTTGALPARAVTSPTPVIVAPLTLPDRVSKPATTPDISDDQSALDPAASPHAAGSST